MMSTTMKPPFYLLNALLIWALAAFFFFYKYLIQVSPSVMSGQLMQAFELSGAGLGHLAACFFYAYLLMQLPAGLIIDKYGPRNLIGLGALTCALGIYGFAHSQGVVSASISRFIIGLSVSFAAISCFKLITIWFKQKQFAFMAGLSMTVAMLGAIAGQVPLAYLVKIYDWRATLSIIAWVGIGIAVLVFLLVPNKKTSADVSIEQVSMLIRLKGIAKNSQNWLLSIYSGLAFAPVSVFGGLWGAAFVEAAYQTSPIQSANVVSYIFIGFAIGAPIFGWLSDANKCRKPFMWLGTLMSLICLSLSVYCTTMSLTLLKLLMLLFGFGTSCFFLCFSMIREINPISLAGTVLGLMNAFDALCEAVTEPLVGKLLDLNWHGQMSHGIPKFTVTEYQSGLVILLIFISLALLTLAFIKETYCQVIE